MTASSQESTVSNPQALVITRTFDAPRDLVYKAITEPERLLQWWGPKGFTMKVAKMDLRSGGVFHYGMTAPDGNAMYGIFEYREIVAPERLVFTNAFADDQGNAIANPWMPTWPLRILNTWTITEQDGKTSLTLHGVPHNASADEIAAFTQGAASMQQGFKGTFDQLDAYLASAQA